jgi:diaminopimelate epimerase
VTHFVKSHGLGNDYLVVEPVNLPFELTAGAVRLICDRNRGVGSDGILVVTDSVRGDIGVRILNPDGSEAEKSGNGIRIFAKFLRDHGYTDRDRFVIETAGGLVAVELERDEGIVARVRADMGKATFDPLDAIEVDGRTVHVTSLSVGNPHCVVVVRDLDRVDVCDLGPKIERHPAFPSRTNVQFAQVMSRSLVRAHIWERGAGSTLASGSSSCAVAAACHRSGLVDREVTVSMPGGALEIAIDADGELRMRGPAEEICTGEFSPELVRRILAEEPLGSSSRA